MKNPMVVDVAIAIELAERPEGVTAVDLARTSSRTSPSFQSAVRRARWILLALEDAGFLAATSQRSTVETPVRGRPQRIWSRRKRPPVQVPRD